MDFVQWANSMKENNTIISYLIYRKPGAYTPYEQENKFSDESVYEDTHYTSAVIREVISLGNGDFLIGMQNIFNSEKICDLPTIGSDGYVVEYVKLSEIRMAIYGADQLPQC